MSSEHKIEGKYNIIMTGNKVTSSVHVFSFSVSLSCFVIFGLLLLCATCQRLYKIDPLSEEI